MAKAELILPGEYSSDDENALVDRLAIASRELVPSVQITLAKRIIKPGTNRVVCLAARTSVPLSDDEVASVSDLALRLSDGTNVALSLSFFNENAASEYATFSRNTYDPNRYSEHKDSRFYDPDPYCEPKESRSYDPDRYCEHKDSGLSMVVIATALAAAAAFFSMTSGPLNTFVNLKAGLASITGPLIHSPSKPAATEARVSPSRPAASAKAAAKPAIKRAKAVSAPKPKQARARSARRAPVRRETMFVPPPPPFPYTLPDGRLITPYDPAPKSWSTANSVPMPEYVPLSQKKAAGQAKAVGSTRPVTHAEAPAQSKSGAPSKPAPNAELRAQPKPATMPKSVVHGDQPAQKPVAQAKAPAHLNSQTAGSQPVREPAATAAARPILELESAKAPVALHQTIWERPARQAPPQQRAASTDGRLQLRAPVPGDDGTAPAAARPIERVAAPPDPAPRYEPIPWPE